jgi:transglutaminase-like putative cysteine protease
MIEGKVIIQQYNEMPLDFIVADYAVNYPFAYTEGDFALLTPHMTLPDKNTCDELNRWVGNFWRPDEKIQTYTLLQRLARYIYDTQTYKVREEPGVQTSTFTLACNTGSCRDFALLFMDAARYLGLASRLVSGYLHAPLMSATVGATHAWAEVYTPGAGWKGFDPSAGDIVGSDRIAVAVARLPESIPPIQGSYLGSHTSTMDVGVWVTKR